MIFKKNKDDEFALPNKEKIPSGSSWKDILNEIYKHAPHMYGESNRMHFNDDRHKLAKKLKITGYELMLGLAFLKDNNLITKTSSKDNSDYSAQLHLTKKGFDVALKNESSRKNMEYQKVMTLAIALTALITLYNLVFPIENLSFNGIWNIILSACKILAILFLFIIIVFIISRFLSTVWFFLFKRE